MQPGAGARARVLPRSRGRGCSRLGSSVAPWRQDPRPGGPGQNLPWRHGGSRPAGLGVALRGGRTAPAGGGFRCAVQILGQASSYLWPPPPRRAWAGPAARSSVGVSSRGPGSAGEPGAGLSCSVSPAPSRMSPGEVREFQKLRSVELEFILCRILNPRAVLSSVAVTPAGVSAPGPEAAPLWKERVAQGAGAARQRQHFFQRRSPPGPGQAEAGAWSSMRVPHAGAGPPRLARPVPLSPAISRELEPDSGRLPHGGSGL